MTAREVWRRDPTAILTRAVEGMLPKNNLQRDRLRKLRVFPGPDHPYGQLHMEPWAMPPKQLEDHKLGWAMPQGLEPMNPEAYARRMRGARRVAGGGQQQQLAAGGAASPDEQQAATAAAVEVEAPVISFDDLLAADEREFVAASVRRRGGGSRP